MIPKILVFPGSNRSGSLNGQLADAAMKTLAGMGAEVTRISLVDYPLPIIDEDLERDEGIPLNAVKLARLINACDGVFIVSPEYNASIPPLLKNTIDWVSRVSDDNGRSLKAWKDRPAAIASASNGKLGGLRALVHVRAVLMNVGCPVMNQQVAVSAASRAFDAMGMLKDDADKSKLDAACNALLDYCMAFARR